MLALPAPHAAASPPVLSTPLWNGTQPREKLHKGVYCLFGGLWRKKSCLSVVGNVRSIVRNEKRLRLGYRFLVVYHGHDTYAHLAGHEIPILRLGRDIFAV